MHNLTTAIQTKTLGPYAWCGLSLRQD